MFFFFKLVFEFVCVQFISNSKCLFFSRKISLNVYYKIITEIKFIFGFRNAIDDYLRSKTRVMN